MQRPTVCLIAVALLTGCGGGGPKSDPDAIRQVIQDAAKAVAGRDGARACGYLTPEAQQQVVTLAGGAYGGTDCAGVVKLVTATLAPIDRRQIEDIEPQNLVVTGSAASAEVVLPNQSLALSLVKTDDGWRISGLTL